MTAPEAPAPVKLVCPRCGSGDNLISWEMEPYGYDGTRFYVNPEGGEPIIDYEPATSKWGEGGSGFLDDIQCDSGCGSWIGDIVQLTLADLVPEGTAPNPDWEPPPAEPTALLGVTISDETS